MIEELTFNPFISRSKGGSSRVSTEIWCELAIRRCDQDEGPKPVPAVRFRFASGDHLETLPSSDLPDSDGAGRVTDANFLMYSDIWYSFVRVDGRDWDFMSMGYNRPMRVLYPCGADAVGCAVTMDWMTGNYAAFMAGRFQIDATRLTKMITLFHRELLHRDETAWVAEPRRVGNEELDMVVPTDTDRFARVSFERPKTEPRGRFAVRRLPWQTEGYTPNEDLAYGIGYGGTVEVIRPNPTQAMFDLNPKLFDPKTSQPIPAMLGVGEAIRFWVHWRTSAPVVADVAGERFGFHHGLEVRPKVGLFNTFFRVPAGFDAVPGSVTPIENYAVPRRLFFAWDEYWPEQCYSFSRGSDVERDRFDIRVAFDDRRTADDRLARIFLVGVFLNVTAAIAVGSMFEAGRVGASEALGPLALWSTLATVVLGAAAFLVYVRRRVRLPALGTGAMLWLLAGIVPQPLYGALAAIGGGVSWVIGIGVTRTQAANFVAGLPLVDIARRAKQRRDFIKSLEARS